MLKPNHNYSNLKDSYLFYRIAQKTRAYVESHDGAYLYRLGIGDVSLPLCDEVIKVCPEFKDFLVPLCVYRGGICTEFHPCGYNKTIKEKQIDSD